MGCGASNAANSIGGHSSSPTEKSAKFVLDAELLELLTTKNPKPVKEEHSEILDLFRKIDDWEFDVEKVSKLTQGRPLIYVITHLLFQHDLLKQLHLDLKKIVQFLMAINDSFHSPFHSNQLAADIAQGYHCIIKRGLKKYLNDEETFAAIMSACFCHLDHPGLSNEYQEYNESNAATLYNSVSILQYRSLSYGFQIIQSRPECDFLADLPKSAPNEQKSNVREIIILMVLATDPKKQSDILAQFEKKLAESCEFSDNADIHLLLQTAMMIASKSFLCLRRLNKHLDWMERFFTEKFTQGDIEREKKQPITKYCDRNGDVQAMVLEMMEDVKKVLSAYYKREGRIKTARQIVKANQTWWKKAFGTSENDKRFTDFSVGFQWHEADQAQSIFEKNIGDEPVPTDQEKVIEQKFQDETRRVQNEQQEKNEKACLDDLVKHFDGDQGESYPPSEVYALVDYKRFENQLTDDDTRKAVLSMFNRLDDWDFDVFTLTELLGGEVLCFVSTVLFAKYGLAEEFKIPRDTLQTFLRTIQTGYQMNPYHNAMHACDAMQITNSIMVQGKMMEKLNKIDVMAAIISSMVHDYDHPGLNNAFQVHSKSYLARVYSDRSVLENHHCASTFKIIRSFEGCNIFSGMTESQKRDARATIVAMVLSTDMTNHGRYIKKFQNRIDAGSDFTSKQDIRCALEIAIKMADVSNPSRPLYLYLQWTKKIIHEFFLQGDKEREYKLPVSPLMDRKSSVLSRGQRAFMQYVITPMFKSFAKVYPGISFCLDLIEQNRSHWDDHKEISEADFEPGEFKEKRLGKQEAQVEKNGGEEE